MDNVFLTKLTIVGTSQCVVIPRPILRALRWQRGDSLIITPQEGDSINVRRLTDKEVFELKQIKMDIHY